MVILYVEGKAGDFTVYLEHPIYKPRFIALRRCAFYNRWKNLPIKGAVFDAEGKEPILSIPAGYYTVETLKRQIDSALSLGEKAISIEESLLKAHQNVVLSDSLADLLGLKNKRLKAKTQHEIQIKTLDAIFIHCDLVSSSSVLKQGAASQILACIEADTGKINFSPHNLIQLSTASVDYVNSLRFCIKDYDGNTIENIYPMRLILEIA